MQSSWSKRSYLTFFFALILTLGNPCLAQGTAYLQLVNVTPTCIDTKTQFVDFWILSARVPRDSNVFKTTKGVGAKVNLTLTGVDNDKRTFPSAATITIADQGKELPVVRASLRLHVLSRYNLWDTTTTPPATTKDINLPVSFVRVQGDSAAVQVVNALVNFTQTSTIVPANPYVKGAEALGQFFTSSLAPIFGNKNDVDDPNFSLDFSTSQVSTGCDTQDLQEGIGIEIADYDKGDEKSGFIQTANRNNYCFYKMYDDRDPDIGFIQKPAGGCPQAVPASLTTLNNPQFIWAASSKGMGRNSTDHRLQVCKSVGISANRCLSKSVGEPLQRPVEKH